MPLCIGFVARTTCFRRCGACSVPAAASWPKWAATEISPPSAWPFAAVLAHHGFAELGERDNYYPTQEAYARRLERHGFAVKRMLLFPRPTPLNEAAWKDG